MTNPLSINVDCTGAAIHKGDEVTYGYRQDKFGTVLDWHGNRDSMDDYKPVPGEGWLTVSPRGSDPQRAMDLVFLRPSEVTVI